MKKHENELKKLVSNLAVMYTKLHHYHWFITGEGFFTIHEKLEGLYDYVTELYDEVAERMIQLGLVPPTTLKSYLELATIKEASETKPCEMLKQVLQDLKLLSSDVLKLATAAGETNDIVSADIFTGALKTIEKQVWFLTAFLTK